MLLSYKLHKLTIHNNIHSCYVLRASYRFGPASISTVIHTCASQLHGPASRYGKGRTRSRTPGSGTKGKGAKGRGKASDWSMALSAVQDLASVARRVVEGQQAK